MWTAYRIGEAYLSAGNILLQLIIFQQRSPTTSQSRLQF